MKLQIPALLILSVLGCLAQDKPVAIAKKLLPKKAVCVTCSLNGEGHEEEKPAGGLMYKGKAYYFCNIAEVATFKADPEAYMPVILPRPAPESLGKMLDGTEVALKDYKDKVLLIDFWATWCSPCVKAMPEMQKLHNKLADKGFSAIGISIDEEGAKKVKPFQAKRKFTYPILLDTDKESPVWKAFGVHGVPALFLVNRKGEIVQQWTGKINQKEVEKAVVELLEAESKKVSK